MDHRDSYPGENGSDTKGDTVGVPSEEFYSGADSTKDEDKFESDNQSQAWSDSAALHCSASDQRHNAEIDAH